MLLLLFNTRQKEYEFNKLLNEEANEINFIKINPSILPELTYQQIKIIKPLLNL